jgi:hypothetical protein
MRLATRVKKLEAAFPPCDGRVRRLAGPDHVPSESDRCPRCGGSHLLVIEEVIVTTTPTMRTTPASLNEVRDGHGDPAGN